MSPEPPRSCVLLDGATATNLLEQGMDAAGCHEEWMLAHPEKVTALQRAFIEAGSRLLTVPSFSANRASLSRQGKAGELFSYNSELCALTRAAAKGEAMVAGNLSPAGLVLAPAGEAAFDELVEIYAEQAAALDSAQADGFLIETMLSVTEARAAVLACRDFGKPVYVSVALNDEGELYSGAAPLAALLSLQGLGIAGFGFNCAEPAVIASALRDIYPFARVPLLAKPSAGLPENTLSPESWSDAMREVLDAGATLVGGCCGTTPRHIACLGRLMEEYCPAVPVGGVGMEEYDVYLTNTSEVFQLDNDRIELTSPIACEYDMANTLLAAEQDSFDVLLIDVPTEDDALLFSQNEHLAHLPVCFRSDNEEALARALFLYNGRCMVDTRTAIGKTELNSLICRFGAVPY